MNSSVIPRKSLVAAAVVASLVVVVALLRAGSSVAQEVQPATEDLTPPELISLQIAPEEIDTDFMDGTITATMRITDDLSGVYRISLRVAPADDLPAGIVDQSYAAAALFDPAEPDLTVDLPVSILQYSKEGEWAVWTVRLFDRIGNSVTYYHPEYGTIDRNGEVQEAFCQRSSGALCLPAAFDVRFINSPGVPLPTPVPTCTPPPCPPHGVLVCSLPEGCPNGCGTICQSGAQLPFLMK